MKSTLRCPYCLMPTRAQLESRNSKSVYVCQWSDCGAEIPRDFVEQRMTHRAVVGLVGFSGHGKTVFITALFHLLRAMQNEWEGFYCRSLDHHTIKSFYDRIHKFKEGELPESTPANFPLPSLFHFHAVPYFGEWYLSFYDTAGEVFEDSQLIPQQGRFLANSDVAIFIVSIGDSGEQWPARLEELLDTYLNGVYNAMHTNLKAKQHLLVVFSKSDRLIGQVPPEIEDFLMKGSYPWYADFRSREEMITQLERSSNNIRRWLESQGANGFVNKAADNFKGTEYMVISSTGAAPVGDRLAAKLADEDPRRVLDPFFWILEKTQPRGFWHRIFRR